MCIRPPCENCSADYDACFPACPKCGHPNEEGGLLIDPTPVIEKEVWCKICKKNHKIIEAV